MKATDIKPYYWTLALINGVQILEMHLLKINFI
jgi:hypothetical protein